MKNANTSSYAMFIRALMEKFGGKKFETHVEETNIPKETKPLHVMEEFTLKITSETLRGG